LSKFTNPFTWAAELIDSGFSVQQALRRVYEFWADVEDAIHDNVAGEIADISAKSPAAETDLLLIEDSADSNNKKKITIADILITETYQTADSVTDNIGAQTPVGSITDTQTALDGNEYNMPENNSNPALDVDFEFSSVDRIRGIVFNARYQGSASHYMQVSIYDYASAVRRELMNVSTTDSNNYRTVLIPDGTNFIDGSGNAQISFHHNLVSGNTSHDLFVEYIALIV